MYVHFVQIKSFEGKNLGKMVFSIGIRELGEFCGCRRPIGLNICLAYVIVALPK